MRPYYEDTRSGIVIYHGDCREVLPMLEPCSMDLVLTDPPYAVSVTGSAHVGQIGKGTRRLDFFDGDEDWQGMIDSVLSAFDLMLPLLRPAGSIYAWVGHRQFGPVIAKLEGAGFNTRFLVWAKECPAPPPPGAGWPSGAELCIYGWRPGRKWAHRGTDTPRSNVLVSDSYRYGQPGKVDHPTQKPLGVLMPLIVASTERGDVLLDSYMGSGSSLVAAKQLGRHACGIEREERIAKSLPAGFRKKCCRCGRKKKQKEKAVTDNSITVRAAGHLGGKELLKRRGLAWFSELGKLGGAAVAKQRGRLFYARIGKLGGEAVKAKLGREWYSEIGTKGGEALKAARGISYYRYIASLRRTRRGGRQAVDVTGWPAELRGRREAAGMRQADVAASVGCRVALISHVECGRGGKEALWRERYAGALRETAGVVA